MPNLVSRSKAFFTKNFSFGKNSQNKKSTVCTTEAITLGSVDRQRNLTEEKRRQDATEQLDTYYGFSGAYLRGLIETQINNKTIAVEMKRLAIALPLLRKFINSISKVYVQNPTRSFFLNDKQIVDEIPSDISDKSKFMENKDLTDTLNSFYNKRVTVSLKEAERLTNLLKTTVYKVITDDSGEIRIKFIPNDTIQICQNTSDPSIANDIAFVRDDFSNDRSILRHTRVLERWSADKKIIPIENEGNIDPNSNIEEDNEAAIESEKLFKSKKIGSMFAPFVVFRESDPSNTFWNIKDGDTFDYIKAINMLLTELRYLIRYTSFGLKYVINGTMDKDSTADPTGFLSFQSASRSHGDAPNITVGEFENKGRIKEVIDSITFNMKMIFDSYNITLDSLISSNSVRSAESQQMDNEELFSEVNSQKDIWTSNEEELFKVMQAVHNRDNDNTVPEGLKMSINFEEIKTQEKTAEDWMVEVQNNISSLIDWMSAENPDLNKDELTRLLEHNIEINALATPDSKNEFEEEKKDDNINQKDKKNANSTTTD